MPTRIQIAKSDIIAWFENSPKSVFSWEELAEILAANRNDWRLAQRFYGGDFVEFLLAKTQLKEVPLTSEAYPSITRFIWREVSDYQLALSLKPSSYLSHGTAVFLHALNDQLPTTIYVNQEQSPKPSGGFLNQEAVHRAFAKPQRQSAYIFFNKDKRIQLINGKFTNRLEVSKLRDPSGALVDATKLERTLIDIVVRPSYSGGPFQVLEAFKRAKDRVSVNILTATLKRLAYIYPYHQVIGFYMERAGFEEARLKQLEKVEINIDFYLAYGLNDKQFDKRWRLFYPRGL